MRNSKILEKNIILKTPKRIVHEKLKLDDGNLIDWYYFDTPQSVMIVPVSTEGKLIMLSLYRYNIKGDFLEFPSGIVNKKESVRNAGTRELMEETGFKIAPEDLVKLGHFYTLPSETNRYITIYLAKNVKKEHLQAKYDNQIEKYFDIHIHKLTISDAFDEIGKRIQGVETINALFMARNYLKKNFQIS